MIGLILGTSEGKNIVSLLNKFTDDIFITTATAYGGELLKDFKYRKLNTEPLDLQGIIKVIKENNINILVDASHPYALEVTWNSIKACESCGVEYVRYERPSVVDKYLNEKDVVIVENYEQLYDHLKEIKGNILNTTGSRNIDKILNFNLPNRIIHRVLPVLKVMNELSELQVKTEDIIAIKGPISYELNCAFIKEFNAKVIIMKDSGVQGGTEEKINAAVNMGIKSVIIGRKKLQYKIVFFSEQEIVEYIKSKLKNN